MLTYRSERLADWDVKDLRAKACSLIEMRAMKLDTKKGGDTREQ